MRVPRSVALSAILLVAAGAAGAGESSSPATQPAFATAAFEALGQSAQPTIGHERMSLPEYRSDVAPMLLADAGDGANRLTWP